MVMMMKAPITGPMMVPSPPTSAISRTSPDIAGLTSVSGGTCRTGERGREHEAPQLVAVGLVTQRQGALLVVADRLQHLPERRMDEAIDGAVSEQEDRQHDIVKDSIVVGRDQPAQQRLAHDALQAVLAVGERRLDAE